ncbi:MAG TPA: thioredoxin family protein [Candidatus Thermoplasmatota archaeon]|nr:thioredoxin family protein [Candidatus Thermoplasmatota archaeon]
MGLFSRHSPEPLEDGSDRFDGPRLDLPGKVAVLFTVDWCPFCRSYESTWRDWNAPEGVQKLRVDISDESKHHWETFDIPIVPTVALFENGRLTWRQNGRAGLGLGKKDLEALRQAAESREGT